MRVGDLMWSDNDVQHVSGFGNTISVGLLGPEYVSGFDNTVVGGFLANGDVSGVMNHVSGALFLDGSTSGYFNTGFPGTQTNLLAGFDSGVNNFGTFVPGLFSALPTLQNLLG